MTLAEVAPISVFDAMMDGGDDPYAEHVEPALDAGADMAQLDRHLRHLRRVEQRIADLNNVCAAEIERIAKFRDDATAALRRRAAWYETALKGYALARYERDAAAGVKPTLTTRLPHGELSVRRTTSIEFSDPAAALAQLEAERPELIEHKLRVGEAKKALTVETETVRGEQVPTGRVILDGEIVAWAAAERKVTVAVRLTGSEG